MALHGKCAFISGGTHGIGLATAEALFQRGLMVITCSRHKIEHGGAIWFNYVCDVEKQDELEDVIEDVKRSFVVDVLINNVGGGGRWGDSDPVASFEDNPNIGREVMRKNLHVAEHFTYAFLPKMVEEKWGRVVTVASIHGREGGGRPWFTAAKAAQIAFMKSLAQMPKYARRGITFNSVAPGPVDIPGTGWHARNERDRIEIERYAMNNSPMGRLGTPEEVAAAIAFLCSEEASWINGACLAVDGGQGAAF